MLEIPKPSSSERTKEALSQGSEVPGLRGWRVLPSLGRLLPPQDLEKLASLCEEKGTTLKRGVLRTLYRLPSACTPGEDLIVKCYHVRPWPMRLLQLFGGSQAEREWRTALTLQQWGIPAPEPLALCHGRRAGGGSQYLVTRAIPEGAPLDARSFGSTREKREVVRQMGELLRSLAAHHLYHQDLHLGNFLLSPTGTALRLYVLDLHRFRKSLRDSKRLETLMLAQLAHATASFRTRRDDAIFLRAYAGADEAKLNSLLKRAPRIARLAGKMAHHGWRSRTRRCLTNSSRFCKETHGRYRVLRDRNWPTPELFELVDRFEQGERQGVTWKNSAETIVRSVAGTGGPICVKKYLPRGKRHLLESLLLSRARRAWVGAHGLAARGVPAGAAAGLLEDRAGQGDYLIMHDLSPMPGADVFLQQNLPGLQAPARALWLASLAAAIASWHRRGIYHGDLKLCNIRVEPMDGGYWFHLIDTDRVLFRRRVPHRRVVKNLAQAVSSAPEQMDEADRRAFLAAYARSAGMGDETAGHLWDAVTRASLRRVRVWVEAEVYASQMVQWRRLQPTTNDESASSLQ